MPDCKHCGKEVDARGLKSHEHWCSGAGGELVDEDVQEDVADELDEDVDEDVDADPELEADVDDGLAADGDGGEWTPEPAGMDSGSDSGTDTRNSGSDSGMDSGTDSGTDSPEGSTADGEDDGYWCGNCDAELDYLQKPCPNCGETPAWSQIA